MAQSRCPYCGHIQEVHDATLGQTVGCMNVHCTHTFIAYEDRRHAGWLSRGIFCGVIVFATYLLLAWTNPKWDVLSQWFGR